MDVGKPEKALEKKFSAETTTRPPLVSADNKNGAIRRSRTREVSSRYKSPTPTREVSSRYKSPTPSREVSSRYSSPTPKRCPSPNASRISSTPTVSMPKRAVSAERKRPSLPSLLPSSSPSTPVKDTAAEMILDSRKTAGNKLPESLWPSTMRSLNVSFQSDNVFGPIGKKEKPVSHTPSDRTLRPSSNVVHKGEAPPARKPTPERKRSPLKGKIFVDQLENSKPVDSLSARLVDQHRWPTRTSGKASTALNRSDFTDKMNKTSSLSNSRTVMPSTRRLSLDGATTKPLQKSASDLLMLISRDDSGKKMLFGSSVDDGSLRMQRPGSSSSSSSVNGTSRAQSLPIPGSRPSSPSVSRGVSPSRAKAVNPSSRGTSPARVRQPSPSRQPQSSTSVLNFIVDCKKGKKAANNIEDVHQLRLAYNRHLQWRYANARTNAVLKAQKAKAEKMLYCVWRTILELRDSVSEKRSDLQQLRLLLKLYSVLDNQLTCLDEWASIEKDHANSLSWAIQDLQATTFRIPVTGGARVDIKTFKAAMCSVVDVMMAMGSSLSSILPQMEGMNSLISEIADVAAHERAMLDECESLLGSTAALQLEESSLRTHLLQMNQD